jgi:hypothetical protein
MLLGFDDKIGTGMSNVGNCILFTGPLVSGLTFLSVLIGLRCDCNHTTHSRLNIASTDIGYQIFEYLSVFFVA